MEQMRTIEEMLEQHERFKEMWVIMNPEIIHEWLCLKEEMERKAIELESEYDEEKITLERDSWLRYTELKDIPTKITDKAVESIISKEMYDRKLVQVERKKIAKQLNKVAENIEHYTNNIKLNIRTTTNI